MINRAIAMMLATALAAPVLAAPRDVSSGMSTGKVSMQDLHFTTRADAVAHCDKAPIATAADGSFTCSAPPSSSMAINEKGLPGTKTKPPATAH